MRAEPAPSAGRPRRSRRVRPGRAPGGRAGRRPSSRSPRARPRVLAPPSASQRRWPRCARLHRQRPRPPRPPPRQQRRRLTRRGRGRTASAAGATRAPCRRSSAAPSASVPPTSRPSHRRPAPCRGGTAWRGPCTCARSPLPRNGGAAPRPHSGPPPRAHRRRQGLCRSRWRRGRRGAQRGRLRAGAWPERAPSSLAPRPPPPPRSTPPAAAPPRL
mmetsp:Transcript_87056/g.281014  ORF Transcript_87056/g.281014 Transcript_87056/m.281014 type:complete len:216 (-) Transcript_87056:1273-1920(-)